MINVMEELKFKCNNKLSWLSDIMEDPEKSKYVEVRQTDCDTKYKWDLYMDFDITKEQQDNIDKEINRRAKHPLKLETIIFEYRAGNFHPIKCRKNSYHDTDISICGYIYVDDAIRNGRYYVWMDIMDKSNPVKFYSKFHIADTFESGKSKLSISYRYGKYTYDVDMDEYMTPPY